MRHGSFRKQDAFLSSVQLRRSPGASELCVTGPRHLHGPATENLLFPPQTQSQCMSNWNLGKDFSDAADESQNYARVTTLSLGRNRDFLGCCFFCTFLRTSTKVCRVLDFALHGLLRYLRFDLPSRWPRVVWADDRMRVKSA